MKQNSVLECIHRNRQWDIGFGIDQNEQDLVRIYSHSQIWTWHWKASYKSILIESSARTGVSYNFYIESTLPLLQNAAYDE